MIEDLARWLKRGPPSAYNQYRIAKKPMVAWSPITLSKASVRNFTGAWSDDPRQY